MSISISAILATLGTAAKVVKEANRLDLYEQITTARTQLADVQNELLDKDERIRQLENSLRLRPRLVLNHGGYYEWLPEKKAYSREPYCTHCWEVDHLAVHLNFRCSEKRAACPRCKGYIDGRSYGEVPEAAPPETP